MLEINNISQWSIKEVEIWLKEINFDTYAESFENHAINGRALIMLDEDDMKQLVDNIGDRKNLYFHIKLLKHSYPRDSQTISRQNSVGDNDSIHKISGHICEKCLKKFENNSDTANELLSCSSSLKSEKLKTFASVLYLFLASMWSTFMLTVVHDRVPDMQKYPPLPDLILGNF
jgi:hypothetical protein